MEDTMSNLETPMPNSSNKYILVLLAVLLAAGGLYWFTTQQASPATTSSRAPVASMTAIATTAPSTLPSGSSESATPSTVAVKTFTLEAGSYYYKPNVINVKVGDKVKVVVNSVDMMHDFVIDELKVKSTVAKSGTSTEVEFTADKVGNYEFYCSVGSHRKMGMVGTLVVTE